jgi:hypothetical protein
MAAQTERAAQELAGPTLSQAQQDVAADGAGRLDDSKDAKVAIPNIETGAHGPAENDPAGQHLLTAAQTAARAIQGRAGPGAEAHDHAHQAPVGRGFGLVAVGRKPGGDIAPRPESKGAPVQQADHQAVPKNLGRQGQEVAALQPEALPRKARGMRWRASLKEAVAMERSHLDKPWQSESAPPA